MGRDKAALVVEGVPLWRRQAETLRATGAAEVFISGRSDGPYAGSGEEVVTDAWADAGPLGGIATSMRRCANEWLLVLAVDMPAMTAEFLRGMAEEAMREGKAIVPRQADGRWEPLAAVYPKAGLEMVERMIEEGRRKMEGLVRELEEKGMLFRREISAEEVGLFENWNEPGDVGRGSTPNAQRPTPNAQLLRPADQ
jgi:molybdenum cofactor guanylyltransferase